ncbi:hypothetical protein F4778DRAFT_100560 [Xylariomycetidae sp. FL2044]|nr:hypothetical protein F4778DRAFT_100560 [Xylariomycetidae sp. FL2044]
MAKIRPRNTFGSRSIALRPKHLSGTFVPPWKPRGPFRFLDLPPELRNHIIRLVILDWNSTHKDVVHLFLACHQVYAEAASMFYYEVVLDNTQLVKDVTDPFLVGRLSRLSPRLYVRDLTIKFCIEDQIQLFSEVYPQTLQEMVENGNLRHLRLEIGSNWPSYGFWGLGEALYCDEVRLVTGKRKGAETEITAPLFVTKPPFQNFLKFLRESTVPKIAVFVNSFDHHTFWCQFHRVHSSGKPCEGEWEGKARWLKVDRIKLYKALKGARQLRPTE